MRLRRTLVVAAVVLAACGGGPGAPPPDSPVTGPTGVPSPVGPSPQVVEPRDGLVDVRPIPWDRARRTGPRTLVVEFTSGVEDCFGLDRVEVRPAPRVVVVTLYEGRVPTAEVCIEVAVRKAVEVRLDEPLGDRDIQDGARAD